MAVAIIAEVTLVGDQIRVLLKLPDGITQPDRGYLIPAASLDPLAALAALARPAAANDGRVKTNLQLLQPGLEIDLVDPGPIDPPEPTEDDLAVAAFVADLRIYRVLRTKAALEAGGVTGADVAQQALVISDRYAAVKPAQQQRFDDALTLAGL